MRNIQSFDSGQSFQEAQPRGSSPPANVMGAAKLEVRDLHVVAGDDDQILPIPSIALAPNDIFIPHIIGPSKRIAPSLVDNSGKFTLCQA